MKTMKKILKFLPLLLLIIFVSDKILLKAESKKTQSYGETVEVEGQKLNIVECGENNQQTIVLLSGYGTAAPGLDFLPLIEDLANDFHVVVIEYLGYGDSEKTSKPRTIENITAEIHEVIQKLGIKNYILGAHSIGGIYSIYYLNQYPGEVQGFFGLDTSVPRQLDYEPNIFSARLRKWAKDLGWIRVARFFYPQGFMATQDTYSEDVKKQIAYRVNRDFANDTQIDEGLHFEENWERVEDLYYPKTIKKIFFLSKKDVEERHWRAIETRNAIQGQSGEIQLLEGSHYIHRSQFEKIAEKIRKEFLNG